MLSTKEADAFETWNWRYMLHTQVCDRSMSGIFEYVKFPSTLTGNNNLGVLSSEIYLQQYTSIALETAK